jgi:hypothetical protein
MIFLRLEPKVRLTSGCAYVFIQLNGQEVGIIEEDAVDQGRGGDVACQVDVNQPIHKVSIASVPQVPTTARHTAVARFAAAAIACWVGGCLHLVVVQGAAPRWVEAGRIEAQCRCLSLTDQT